MSANLNMTVSPATKKDGSKVIYVEFSDGERTAEGQLPDGKLISNRGFTAEEAGQLEEYIRKNQEIIREMAKNVDPMRSFLGKENPEK